MLLLIHTYVSPWRLILAETLLGMDKVTLQKTFEVEKYIIHGNVGEAAG